MSAGTLILCDWELIGKGPTSCAWPKARVFLCENEGKKRGLILLNSPLNLNVFLKTTLNMIFNRDLSLGFSRAVR